MNSSGVASRLPIPDTLVACQQVIVFEVDGNRFSERVVILGRLSSMSQRTAEQHVRAAGGEILTRLDPSATLVVVGEDGPSPSEWLQREVFAAPEIRTAHQSGHLHIVRESELWRRLGVLDSEADPQRLYTPAMVAELIGVPVATVRRWKRVGLLGPVREVQRLALFDFEELAAARHLAELAAAGCSLRDLKRVASQLVQAAPDVDRPLSRLPIVVEGKHVLIRAGDDLIEPGGQLRIDFDSAGADPETEAHQESTIPVVREADHAEHFPSPTAPDEMLAVAAELEDAGELPAAANMYRAVLAAAGPNAEVNFLLADVLYAQGELAAARERYYCAIELEEEFVEARANLGCVLAELDELELAVATFQGALASFADFADVHLHLARTLDALGRQEEAEAHWQSFLRLSPESPWADEAAQRLR